MYHIYHIIIARIVGIGIQGSLHSSFSIAFDCDYIIISAHYSTVECTMFSLAISHCWCLAISDRTYLRIIEFSRNLVGKRNIILSNRHVTGSARRIAYVFLLSTPRSDNVFIQISSLKFSQLMISQYNRRAFSTLHFILYSRLWWFICETAKI